MSSTKKIAEFPDVEAKLQKPTKKSAFERQKAEAEAKRLREAAETAAVYEDFVKSFDADDDDDGDNNNNSRGNGYGNNHRGMGGGRGPGGGFPSRGGGAIIGGGGRRHFGGSGGLGLKSSGPGTLGPPAPSFGKKRTYEGFAVAGGANNNSNNHTTNRRDHSAGGTGRLGFDDNEDGPKPLARAFDASDDDEERAGYSGSRSEDKAVARPTLRLVNLPPATSPAVIKALIPSTLAVEGVKILSSAAAPTPPGGTTTTTTDRKSSAAIVTLGQDTAASDIDAAVSALQNRYLGFGYYLSLHRHLSSAAMAMAAESSVVAGPAGTAWSHPFGAKPVATPGASAHGPGGGPHHGGGGGPGRFAPPTSYSPAGGGGAPLNRALLHVPIHPPRDIKQLRMIHKVVEGVLEHGPEFEALLMSRPDVQREEKWAWLWDARSQGGVWYRWRLWEIVTGGGGRSDGRKGKYLPLFEGSHAWKLPEKQLVYEYTTGVDGFVSESEYDSEFDEEDEDEPKIITDGGPKGEEEVFLNPIEKAKLVHLLSRLPTTLSKIRKGDIARITSFAITHANRGADEIVDLVVSNLERPLAFFSANPDYKKDAVDHQSGDSRDASPAAPALAPAPAPTSDPTSTTTTTTSQDTSGAKLVALYVISDILSSSSTSGVRHAWRYRQLLEAALKARHVFAGLGLLPETLNWGRLRAEKWKRSIGLVLSLWDGWCVFPNDSQELFVRSFENPPSAKKEEKSGAAGDEAEKAKGRWKTVEAGAAAPGGVEDKGVLAASEAVGDIGEGGDSDGSYDEYTDDEELDNELLAQYHIDGESLLDIDIVGLAIEGEGDVVMGGGEAPAEPGPEPKRSGHGHGPEASASSSSSTGAAAGKRKRMTAADMFADSDSGDDK